MCGPQTAILRVVPTGGFAARGLVPKNWST
jgi:hypothetical protein